MVGVILQQLGMVLKLIVMVLKVLVMVLKLLGMVLKLLGMVLKLLGMVLKQSISTVLPYICVCMYSLYLSRLAMFSSCLQQYSFIIFVIILL